MKIALMGVFSIHAAFAGATQAQDYSTFAAKAKQALTKDLKDPDSAKFRNTYVYRDGDGKKLALCGEINAKNSYGAYVGFRKFHVTHSGNPTIQEDGDSPGGLFDILHGDICDKKLAQIK